MSRNYSEFKSFGRGSGTADPFYVAFEPQLIVTPVASGISPLSDKSGLIIKRIGKVPLSGFIALDEFYSVYRKYKFSLDKICEAEMCPPAERPEYVFRMGQFKGKTPSQLLLSGTKKEDLLSQKDFLAKNAQGKYEEDNKRGIADIEKAIKKFEEGTLKPSSTTSFTVYDSGPRYFPLSQAQPYQTTGWNLKIICNTIDANKNYFTISWEKKTVTINENIIKAVEKNSIKSESVGLKLEEFSSAMEEAMLIFKHAQDARLSDHLNYAAEHKDDWKNNSGNGKEKSSKPAAKPVAQTSAHQTQQQTSKPAEKPANTPANEPVENDFKDVDECPFV